MAALRCMLEKVGRIGIYNHGVRWTKLGVFGAVNLNNYNYQHLLSRHSSFGSLCPGCMKLALRVPGGSEEFDGPPFASRIQPYLGSMDDPVVTRAALFAVEQYNKQQNTNLEFVRVVKMNLQLIGGVENYITLEAIDNGVKNNYQAKVWLSVEKWELQLFKLAPDNQTTLIDKQATSCSIKNAMAVLCNLPDVKSCDELFLFASNLFLKDINREMFLNGLQSDQERLAWLQWKLARARASQSQVIIALP